MASVKSINIGTPVIASILSASQTVAQTTPGWIDMGQFEQIRLLVNVGTMAGGSTLDVSTAQATSNSGGGTKAVTGKAITQMLAANSGGIVEIIVKASDLDVNNGFRWVQFTITAASGAVVFGAVVEGVDVRTSPQKANVLQSIAS